MDKWLLACVELVCARRRTYHWATTPYFTCINLFLAKLLWCSSFRFLVSLLRWQCSVACARTSIMTSEPTRPLVTDDQTIVVFCSRRSWSLSQRQLVQRLLYVIVFNTVLLQRLSSVQSHQDLKVFTDFSVCLRVSIYL